MHTEADFSVQPDVGDAYTVTITTPVSLAGTAHYQSASEDHPKQWSEICAQLTALVRLLKSSQSRFKVTVMLEVIYDVLEKSMYVTGFCTTEHPQDNDGSLPLVTATSVSVGYKWRTGDPEQAITYLTIPLTA